MARLGSVSRAGRVGLALAVALVGAVAGVAVAALADARTETFSLRPALSTADQHTTTTDFTGSGVKVSISGVVTASNGPNSKCLYDAFYYDDCSGNWSPTIDNAVHFGVVGDTRDGPFVPVGALPAFQSNHVYSFTSTLYEHHLWFWATPFGAPNAGYTYAGGFSVSLTPAATTTPTSTVPPTSAQSVRVSAASGEVTYRETKGGPWLPLTSGTVLPPTAELSTGIESSVTVTLADGDTMHIGELTQILSSSLSTDPQNRTDLRV